MKTLVLKYAYTLAIFLAIDVIWLGVVANGLYADKMGELMADEPKLWAAGLFYALFVVGLLYFVLLPAKSLRDATIKGLVFGFMTYITYDLTNYAVIENWPWILVPIDIAWGTFLSGTVANISYRLIIRIK